MITREKSLELLDKYITTPWLRMHMRESEAIMRDVAKHFGEDEDLWGLSGLLHDLDFDYVEKDPQRHVVEFDVILEKEGLKVGEDIPEEMYHAIKAHYEEHPDITQKRESKLDIALAASETISGFLVASALVQPDKKISSVDVDSVMRKFKKKDFAKAVRREVIYEIEEIGIPIEDFVKMSLKSLSDISEEIGL
ncbi:HD domain-containing protein [Candidatus Microgenomates bacterium]|jgi:hypothetical protein|nr:HD domain-containing protein [Candidatus Microgenomates bacterium]